MCQIIFVGSVQVKVHFNGVRYTEQGGVAGYYRVQIEDDFFDVAGVWDVENGSNNASLVEMVSRNRGKLSMNAPNLSVKLFGCSTVDAEGLAFLLAMQGTR